MKIYKCKKCGNIIVTIKEKCDMLSCCGEGMVELKANNLCVLNLEHNTRSQILSVSLLSPF